MEREEHLWEIESVKELWRDVMILAIRDALTYKVLSKEVLETEYQIIKRNTARDAYVWILAEDQDTGFIAVCEALNYCPIKIRRFVRDKKPDDANKFFAGNMVGRQKENDKA